MRLVVLGDSIMWGQGLRETEKFSTAIQQWLQKELARDVEMQVLAHSRAVIKPDPVKDLLRGKPGEIPDKHPSITAQAEQVTHPEDVNFLLVDGCTEDRESISCFRCRLD